MEVITQTETVTKLTLLPKPLDEYTDEELLALFETTIRPARGRVTARKKKDPAAGGAKPKSKPAATNILDDLDIA